VPVGGSLSVLLKTHWSFGTHGMQPVKDETLVLHHQQSDGGGWCSDAQLTTPHHIHRVWTRDWGKWNTPHARLHCIQNEEETDSSEEAADESTLAEKICQQYFRTDDNVLQKGWQFHGDWNSTHWFGSEEYQQMEGSERSCPSGEVLGDRTGDDDPVLSLVQADISGQPSRARRLEGPSQLLDNSTYWAWQK